eukprot:12091923-Alexandrium_andersonii.AAC.1
MVARPPSSRLLGLGQVGVRRVQEELVLHARAGPLCLEGWQHAALDGTWRQGPSSSRPPACRARATGGPAVAAP